MTGFEPATTRPPDECATTAPHPANIPDKILFYLLPNNFVGVYSVSRILFYFKSISDDVISDNFRKESLDLNGGIMFWFYGSCQDLDQYES